MEITEQEYRAARRAETVRRSLERMTRMWPLPDVGLLRAGIFITGPRARRLFGITRRPIADVAPFSAPLHRPGKQLWWYDLEDDVRELVCEPLSLDRIAQWSDPKEQLGLA